IVQMTISRSREFMADEGSARLTGHPEWLQSALIKLDNYAHGNLLHNAEPQSAHMFIVNPFLGLGGNIRELFSTHPTTAQRIERLEALK
ncbi:MAG: M48 family metalloprotease, partial [Epsilonproteobacteria bacterium]|nr:M48 family metalloprotease [Campylobacterota bacterium]